MAIQSSVISPTKIKFRYGEPYGSEASNVQMGVNDRGAYRGALVQQESPDPEKTFRINTEDGDSVVLHRDPATGYCVVVRETVNVQMDMISRFSSGGAIPAGGEEWFVFMVADYGIEGSTTASFQVDTVVPANAVMLAKIEMPAGATEIKQEYIKTDGSNRDKVAKKHGVSVVKRVTIPAQLGRTRFQIEDKVCFLGDEDEDQSRSKIRLTEFGYNSYIPLVGSDGGQIIASNWFAAETGGSALQIEDMDKDGCYENPWIEMSFLDTVDTSANGELNAFYYAYVAFDEWLVSDNRAGFMGLHTNDISGKNMRGTPDTVWRGTLSEQLSSMLSLVNNRVREKHSGTGTQSEFILMWRSKDVDDADVDENVVSVYFRDRAFLLVFGGFVVKDGIWDSIRVEKSAGTNMVSFYYSSGKKMAHGSINVPTVPSQMRMLSSSAWDVWEEKDITNYDTPIEQRYFVGKLNKILGGNSGYAYERWYVTPGENGIDKNIQLLKLEQLNSGIYLTQDGAIVIANNCYWSEGNNRWQITDGSVLEARVATLGNGIAISSSKYGDLHHPNPGDWVDNSPANFTGLMQWGLSVAEDQIISCAMAIGVYEEIGAVFSVWQPDTDRVMSWAHLNFRNYRIDYSLMTGIEWDLVSTGYATEVETEPVISNMDAWGCRATVWLEATPGPSPDVPATRMVDYKFKFYL